MYPGILLANSNWMSTPVFAKQNNIVATQCCVCVKPTKIAKLAKLAKLTNYSNIYYSPQGLKAL